MAATNLTPERARALFNYDPETGLFTWRTIVRYGKQKVGSTAGFRLATGYMSISIGRNHAYLAHRLAWFMTYDRWPRAIDHIDGDRSNNRLSNLREADHTTNMQNRHGPSRDNKTGFLGVSQNGRKFSATIYASGKALHLGQFTTPELAHAAYLSAKRKLHPGFVE